MWIFLLALAVALPNARHVNGASTQDVIRSDGGQELNILVIEKLADFNNPEWKNHNIDGNSNRTKRESLGKTFLSSASAYFAVVSSVHGIATAFVPNPITPISAGAAAIASKYNNWIRCRKSRLTAKKD